LGVAVVIWGYRRFYRSSQGRLLIDRLSLRLPLFGSIFIKMDLARFFRTLGAMLASGVPILESLQVVGGVINNRILQQKVANLQEKLRQGAVISQVLAADSIFPSMAVHMIGVGEETGHLDEMLEKLAEMYDTGSGSIEKHIKKLQSEMSRLNHPSKNTLYAMSKLFFQQYDLYQFQEEYYRTISAPNPLVLKRLDAIMESFLWDWEAFSEEYRIVD